MKQKVTGLKIQRGKELPEQGLHVSIHGNASGQADVRGAIKQQLADIS